ncbi:MAG TPA: ATP-binding protein [Blastocatellia bacterium]|nr:ATP-binding protein [Blastocatellia bacterium]
MNKENFISEALGQHSDLLAYHVSRKLAERYSERVIIEGQEYAFNIEEFARDEQCDVVCEVALHNQLKTEWMGIGRPLKRAYENAWLSVMWRDQLLDVILMTYVDGGCKSRSHWIIAETREVAEGFLRAVCDWACETRGEILVFDDGYWRKSNELYAAIKSTSFDNLILPGGLKQELTDDFTRFLASREMYERYGIPWKRGVLLTGPPGNGKTHAVKAIINRLGLPCLYVKSLKADYGEDGAIKRVFARARQIKPCLVVLEDLDSLIARNSRSFFLNELDGFAENTGVVVLATTNHPEKLDPAILDRPSRFDRKFHFGLPGPAERLRYLQAWNEKLHDDARLSDDGAQRIAGLTEGFSFAYLKELVLSSLMQWVSDPLPGKMDGVMAGRAAVLREQMKSEAEKAAKKKKKSGDGEDNEE